VRDLPTPPTIASDILDDEARERARDQRRFVTRSGRMEPELRFRVLLATLKMETDFLDLADKKARFALMIMSVLNAITIVLIVKGVDIFSGNDGWALLLRVEAALYGAATVYYIWQAIETLRPRGQRGRLHAALPTEIVPGETMRMLFHADIAKRDRDDYRALWSELRLDNVTTELSDQLHMVSSINVLKYSALAKLYHGVGVMTIILTIALLLEGVHRILG